MLYKEFKQYREKELWADSYYCGTAGHVSQEQVIRYIAEHLTFADDRSFID